MKLKAALDLYTDFLIVQNSLATSTGCAELINHKVKHDTFTRALSIQRYDSKFLWENNSKFVRTIQNDNGVLILDNSVIHKPYSKKTELVNYHYDHAFGKAVKGINLLSSIVQYSKTSIPVGFETIVKDQPCIKKNKQGKDIMGFKSRFSLNYLARKLVKQASKNNILFKYILGDSWFASKENIHFFQNEKRKFILGLPKNRLIAQSYKDYKSKNYVHLNTLELKDGESRRIYLKDIKYPLVITYKVFKNEDASTGELYLVTNELELSGDCIYKIYQRRWNIETYHRSLKQNSSLGKSPTSVKKTQNNHVCLSLLAYSKLEKIMLCDGGNHYALKHQLIIAANQASYKKMMELQDKLKYSA